MPPAQGSAEISFVVDNEYDGRTPATAFSTLSNDAYDGIFSEDNPMNL